jgi:hypothetical protein
MTINIKPDIYIYETDTADRQLPDALHIDGHYVWLFRDGELKGSLSIEELIKIVAWSLEPPTCKCED